MVAGKVEATDVCLRVSWEVQNRPNGDVGITQGGRAVRTGEWTTGSNVLKDALVSLANFAR